MRSACLVLAVLAGSVAAQTAPIDDPDYLLTAAQVVAPTLPAADAPLVSISTTPTIVPVVNTEAATSAPAITQLSAFAASSTFIGQTSELPEAHTAKSVLESLSSLSTYETVYPPLPTPTPTPSAVQTNATGQGPPVTELKTFSGPIETDLPAANTAHTVLASMHPSLTLVPSSAATSPLPSLPAEPLPAPVFAPAPAPAPAPVDGGGEKDCEKGKTTLVTSARPGTAPAYGQAAPTGSYGGSKGGRTRYGPPLYKKPSTPPSHEADFEGDAYGGLLSALTKWAAANGYA